MAGKRSKRCSLTTGTAGILAAVDGACLMAAYIMSVWITLPAHANLLNRATQQIPLLAAAGAVWFATAFYHHLWLASSAKLVLHQLVQIAHVFLLWAITSIFFIALLEPRMAPRSQLLIFLTAHGIIVIAARSTLHFSGHDVRHRGYNARRILVVGANPHTARLVQTIHADVQYDCQIEGFLDDDPKRRQLLEKYNIPYLGTVSRLEALLTERIVDAVYVYLPLRSFYGALCSIIYLCEGVGVPVRVLADPFPMRAASTTLSSAGHTSLVSLRTNPKDQMHQAAQRGAEVALSSLLLLFLSPLFLLVAVAIRIESNGPICSNTIRISRKQSLFEMLEFRTTQAGTQNSPTTVGTFLRAFRLHKLPQLMNVLRGDMALVGATPPSPSKTRSNPGQTQHKDDIPESPLPQKRTKVNTNNTNLLPPTLAQTEKSPAQTPDNQGVGKGATMH